MLLLMLTTTLRNKNDGRDDGEDEADNDTDDDIHTTSIQYDRSSCDSIMHGIMSRATDMLRL